MMKQLNIVASALIALSSAFSLASEAPVKVRIGWQVPWATQGQLVQVLKHTDTLKKNGLTAEFIGRTYGPQLNEIALAGEVDVILTADQPAATLFAKDKGWVAIGRLMYNRTTTYVPPKSPIKTIADLKGKTIGIPVGAAAERVTVEALKKAGLDPKADVKIINLDIKEQGPLVLKGKDSAKWGEIDALAGFDPIPAIFEAKGLVRVLDVGKVVSLIVAQEEFLKKNPGVEKKIVASFLDAYDHYRQNRKQANDWFLEEAKLQDADQKACDIAASIEPNVAAKERPELRMTFVDEDFATMQKAADFLEGKIGKKVEMRKYVK